MDTEGCEVEKIESREKKGKLATALWLDDLDSAFLEV